MSTSPWPRTLLCMTGLGWAEGGSYVFTLDRNHSCDSFQVGHWKVTVDGCSMQRCRQGEINCSLPKQDNLCN